MIFVKERVQVIADQLKKNAVVTAVPLTQWQYKEGNFLRPADVEAAPATWGDFNSLVMHWTGPDKHWWFRTQFTVPDSHDGRPLWLRVRTQIDEWDDGKNPQFLLFLNGDIIQGIDMNHREVRVTDCAKAGQVYQIDLQSYTGTLHSDFQLLVEMQAVDEQTLGLYYDILIPLQAVESMKEETKTRLDLESALNKTINLLDFRQVPSAAFSDSVNAARTYIAKEIYEKLSGHSDVMATCIGHTHIDVAWWWTVEQTREKVARSFATVLKLMDEYPEYRFMSSQPQLYDFLKTRYPELYTRVKARIAEGRWEPEGGMWLEADCNLSSGESLIRQFLYGKRFFKEEFDLDNRVLWLPDVFGYSGAMPQIMKMCGIDYFMTTKLSWNQFNRVPHDTLVWRGIDGSEVLTHLITTPGIKQAPERFFTTYNGELHPDTVMGSWTRYQDKEINNETLICYGFGDGGGGPTRNMLETSHRLAGGLTGVPAVRQGFSADYFDRLAARVKDNKQLATWVGEFYFEYHRGTYTSMARNKRANRKSELMLMDLELLSLLAGADYPKQPLEDMWKIVLLNQFHDILPGTCIAAVYEQTKIEYDAIAAQGQALLRTALSKVAGDGSDIVIFNTLGFVRDDVVCLGSLDATAIADGAGHVYPVQQTAEGAISFVKGLPAKGYMSFSPSVTQTASPFVIHDDSIETPFYRVSFDATGSISSLFDKENHREVVQPGQQANRLCVYEDKPIYYDNWDIDIFYTEKSWNVEDIVSVRWTDRGPVRATLEVEKRFSSSDIKQRIHFYADTRRIDFETVVDWRENQHLLKVHFPVDIHADEATFDIQFGNVKRATHKNTSWDVARFESCAHKWMDFSEGGYGVSLLNDCKYGHSVSDSEIALTLIKSGIEPNPHTDQERHVFTYALYPHAGDWREGETAVAAAMLNQPAYAVQGHVDAPFSFVSVDVPHVMLETVKAGEDGQSAVLRLYEYHNRRGQLHLTLYKPAREVWVCDALEQPVEQLTGQGCVFVDSILPYQIKTYKIVF